MLELVRKIMGKRIEPTQIPKQFEPSQTLADISKAKLLLGWTPKIDLEEGLRRII
jgi:nucleoside-diphosphate-sugar epimerase